MTKESMTKSQTINSKDEIAKALLFSIEGSVAVSKAAEELQAAKDKKLRLESEFTKFKERKAELETSIEELKGGFGENDSFADMEQLKQLKIELETVIESIPLIEKKLAHEGDLKRLIEDLTSGLELDLGTAVGSIKEQLQAQLDAKVKAIEKHFSDITEAISDVIDKQKLIPKTESILMNRSLRKIAPDLDSDKLKQYMDDPFYHMRLAARVKNNMQSA